MFSPSARIFPVPIFGITALQEHYMTASRMLTMDEASEYLGIPKGTLYVKYRIWHIPFYKPGRSVLFREDELAEWLAAQRRVA
jgi:excisionase family DNA binding protein